MAGLFEGRVAIVTGSGQGVGKAIAVCLAKEGCKVVTNNRKPGSNRNSFDGGDIPFTESEKKRLDSVVGDAESTAAEIIAAGGEAIPVYADVAKAEDCKKLVDAAVEKWGRIDIIINNAAATWVGNVADMPIDKFDVVVASKLNGAFYMLHYALPYMKEQKYGRILNVSSNAFQGLMGMSAYSAAACGVWAMTKSVAQDLAGTGITCNCYTPLAKTRSWYNMLATYRLQNVPEEAIEAGAPDAMKTGPEGMAPFICYLCSEEAEYINGIMFNVAADGYLAVHSDSQEYNVTQKNILQDGPWTYEELRVRVKEELMKDVKGVVTSIELH